MNAIVDSVRWCPFCDRGLDASYCAEHFVPTIGAGSNQDATLEVGTVIDGRYRIERMLKRGGMGIVAIARQLRVGRIVAIKLLQQNLRADRSSIMRFYQEAQIASQLNHPNIVDVIELGFDDLLARPFIVMEHIQGETLSEMIARTGPLTEQRATRILAQVARALRVAHDAGFVHRDLTPTNIMITHGPEGEEHVRVLDFGLARPTTGGPSLTAPGFSVGTPQYMSPEQYADDEIGARSDLYSLGCVLHFVLTGASPFFSKTPIEVLRRHLVEPAPGLPISLVDRRGPSALIVELHRKLLAKHPEDRPTTEHVVQVLTMLADGSGAEEASCAAALDDDEPPTVRERAGITAIVEYARPLMLPPELAGIPIVQGKALRGPPLQPRDLIAGAVMVVSLLLIIGACAVSLC